MSTKIEWTHIPGHKGETWNPVTGCSKVSSGCKNCYAEGVAHRFWKNRKFTDVQTHEDRIDTPLHWKAPRAVFVNSMSDLFHESVPFEFIDKVFAAMALTPRHIYMILTKRPERMREYITQKVMGVKDGFNYGDRINLVRAGMLAGMDSRLANANCKDCPLSVSWPLPNVWLGVSVEDQATADKRIPTLLETPAACRFVSYEPALGSVDFGPYLPWSGKKSGLPSPLSNALEALSDIEGIDWLICGGESGPGARPFNVEWARWVRDQCKAAGVAFFMKQAGAVPILTPGIGETCKERADDEHRQEMTWPEGTFFGNRTGRPELNGYQILLKDPKGGAPDEWPEDLRVREMPV